ncbi:MAG: hypothetical protein WCI61_11925 [Chloroflexota bacterium]
MFGYEPPKQQDPGSWSEIFAMIRVVFAELARPLLAIFVTLGLVLATLFLLFSNPVMALIPIAILGGGVWWLVRKDKQSIREAEDNLPPHR